MRNVPLRSLISVIVVGASSLYVTAQYQHPELHAPGLSPEYRKWLDEDVRWIITTPERKELISLSSNEQRAQFVIAFWERRNPTPGSKGNAFKQEHYRRLAFSNQHFASGVAGWKTDRGRIYVVYGPPDLITKHPSVGANPPDEIWLYRYMPGGGENISLRFVDTCDCGDYHLVSDLPNEKWQN